MKLSKSLLNICLSVLLFGTSCSSSDDSPSEQPEDNHVDQKLVSISYAFVPGLAYYLTAENYEYDDLNRISRINQIGAEYGVTYINDNLIEVDLLEFNSSTELEGKTAIHLENSNVRFITENRTYRYEDGQDFTAYKDSILFTYASDYISKIEYYTKAWGSLGISWDYRLEKQLDYQVSNGNITQVIRTDLLDNNVTTSNYTYDAVPHIAMSELAHETPCLMANNNILIYDRLGKKSVNNIISVENTFKDIPFHPSFESVDYSRKIDKYGRLTEISISGNAVTSNPSNSNSSFTNHKIGFTYK